MKQVWDLIKERKSFILGTITIVSILLNGFFIKDAYFKDPVIVGNNKIIKNVKNVVGIKPIVEVKKQYVERPTANIPSETIERLSEAKGIIKEELPEDRAKRIIDEVRKMAEAEETLKALEKEIPKLRLEEIQIVQQEDDTWVIPPSVKGDLSLGYLKYDVDVKLDADLKYRKRVTLPFSIGNFIYYQDQSLFEAYNIMMPFKVPFTQVEVFLGAGTEALSLSSGFRLTKNSFAHLGMFYTYDRRFAPAVGISFDF